MQINCGIIDDDEVAISIIKSYIAKLPETQLVFSSTHPLEAQQQIEKKALDLLFLDVEMPEISGIDFLYTLNNPPKVIITSAKKDYAAESFELEVLDYIVKPVSFQRFVTSIKKYRKTELQKPKKNSLPSYLFLKENKKRVRVELNNILYIESIKDYIKVVTSNKTIVTKELISNFHKQLAQENFIRVHRSFIVNIDKIAAYSSSLIEIGNTEVPIGRNYKEEFLARLA